MKIITSVHNAEIKELVRLHQAKERNRLHLFLAEGVRTLSGILSAGLKPETLYMTEDATVKYENLIKQIDDEKTCLVSDHVMAKISSATTPSGLLGVFKKPDQPDTNMLKNGLVLVQIADPGNMGTLIRTAAAFGVQSVICVEGTDPWSPKVVQASAGTIATVKIIQSDWQTVVAARNNRPLYGLVTPETAGATPLTEIKCADGFLVVGSEAHGLPQDYQNDCTNLITIPMPGDAESLNAAIAGSIALYITFGSR